MLIREMEAKDNLVVKEIIQASLTSFGLNIPGTAYFDPQLGDLYGYYHDIPAANYWVAELDGQVVGGCGIGPYNEAEGICELQKIYILPETQGTGLGRQLAEKALSFAGEHYTCCYLETVAKMESANRLYQRLGFEQLPEPLPGSEHGAMDRFYLKQLGGLS